MPRLHERGFDIPGINFVEHAFNESFDGIFGRAKGSETGCTERAGGAAEDEEAAGALGAEVGQGELQDVEGAVEVCFELRAQFVVGLVFAGAYYAVACAARVVSWLVTAAALAREWELYFATTSTLPQCSMVFLMTASMVSGTLTSHNMPIEFSTCMPLISSMDVSAVHPTAVTLSP